MFWFSLIDFFGGRKRNINFLLPPGIEPTTLVTRGNTLPTNIVYPSSKPKEKMVFSVVTLTWGVTVLGLLVGTTLADYLPFIMMNNWRSHVEESHSATAIFSTIQCVRLDCIYAINTFPRSAGFSLYLFWRCFLKKCINLFHNNYMPIPCLSELYQGLSKVGSHRV